MTIARVLIALAAVFASGCAPTGPRATAAQIASIESGAYRLVGSAETRVHFLRAGREGGRRVIFIHGTPGEASGWADYLHSVPQGAEYFAIDRLGFGGSEPDHVQPSLIRQAAALEPLLQTPDERPVVLVGHSYGGPVVAQAAVLFPDRVKAIVILAGSLDPGQENIHPLQYVGEWWGIRHILPRSLRNANREILGLEPELRRLAPNLARIRSTVTIVHGTDDKLVPVANVDWMALRFRSASKVDIVTLPDQGHFLPWERRAEIQDILARLTAS
jgi:pimeloyl-ACP methyl ester carboxylesterase